MPMPMPASALLTDPSDVRLTDKKLVAGSRAWALRNIANVRLIETTRVTTPFGPLQVGLAVGGIGVGVVVGGVLALASKQLEASCVMFPFFIVGFAAAMATAGKTDQVVAVELADNSGGTTVLWFADRKFGRRLFERLEEKIEALE